MAGETGSCDRRSGTQPKPFCQEVIETVALSYFADDCRDHHRAAYAERTCSQTKSLGGCRLLKANDDGSVIIDWFYDVSQDPSRAKYPQDEIARTEADVKRFCADKKRYTEGATFIGPQAD